jgi:hypothetical protein
VEASIIDAHCQVAIKIKGKTAQLEEGRAGLSFAFAYSFLLSNLHVLYLSVLNN